ncbi:MAG TPA: response regulator transcription factor [Actinomycetales bacterium]|jgi:DNA-binding NarL/FixJ family response regulator|nr:response regulator transcription factor [Actinomycetales bacterium]
MAERRWKVLIVEDHSMVAAGLQALLEDDPEIAVIGRASTVAEGCALADRTRPHVVLLDFRMPDLSGADAVRAVLAALPDVAVLTVTASTEAEALEPVVRAGAMGFVRKDAEGDELALAVKTVAAGGAHFSRTAMSRLVQIQAGAEGKPVLSPREIEVLQSVADGSAIPKIATELHLSQHTVRNHLRSAMTKLGVHTTLDAVVRAARARLIDLRLSEGDT